MKKMKVLTFPGASLSLFEGEPELRKEVAGALLGKTVQSVDYAGPLGRDDALYYVQEYSARLDSGDNVPLVLKRAWEGPTVEAIGHEFARALGAKSYPLIAMDDAILAGKVPGRELTRLGRRAKSYAFKVGEQFPYAFLVPALDGLTDNWIVEGGLLKPKSAVRVDYGSSFYMGDLPSEDKISKILFMRTGYSRSAEKMFKDGLALGKRRAVSAFRPELLDELSALVEENGNPSSYFIRKVDVPAVKEYVAETIAKWRGELG